MKLSFLVPLFCQKLIWIPTRLLLILCGRLRIVGLENLKDINTPIVFACNHSNEIDPFMVPASLPFFSRFSPLFYIVREKEFYNDKGWMKQLFNSWFIKMWGGYSAKIGLHDYSQSLQEHIALLQQGRSFCVFPEGHITRDGKIQEGKGGISYLAHGARCVIIPVGISNVYKMAPMEFFTLKRKIIINFGKSILPDSLYSHIPQPHEPGKSVWKEEANYIMSKINELIVSS